MIDRERSIDWTFADDARSRPTPRWLIVAFVTLALAIVSFGVWHVRAANERERRERCALNLRQIGQAILLYANEHRNRYPDSFATLARNRFLQQPPIDLATFVCPSSDDAPPASAGNADAGSYRLIADTMPSWLVFYSGNQFAPWGDRPLEAVAIEVPGHHAGGVYVLLADGHVEFRTVADARGGTWPDVQDDVIHDRPIRWPASQPTR